MGGVHVLLALWLQSMSYLRHRALQTEEKYCVQGVVVLQQHQPGGGSKQQQPHLHQNKKGSSGALSNANENAEKTEIAGPNLAIPRTRSRRTSRDPSSHLVPRPGYDAPLHARL